MELQDQLVAIERRLWTNDAKVYESHLGDEALLAFPETGVITKRTALEAIRRENEEGRYWADVQFNDVRVLRIGADAALLTYRVSARWAHEISSTTALATSTYVRSADGWKLAFHRQSRLDEPHRGNERAPARVRRARPAAPVWTTRARAFGAWSAGAAAIGALAVGATAIGALAIGRMTVGAFVLKRGRVGALTVNELRIGRLRIHERVVDEETGISR
jgi:hypothetical protein